MKTIPVFMLLFLMSGCNSTPNAYLKATSKSKQENNDWLGYHRLSGTEIVVAFKDVVDHASVIDGEGGIATNYWYQDGRFFSNWKVGDKSGKLSGSWFVENDTRCIIVDMSIGDLTLNEKRCSPIYSKEGKYYSVNKAGHIHGIHVLLKLNSIELKNQ